MSFKAYATPHSHPASLDSASTPEAFAKREVELGGKHLTCTDHGSLAAIQQIMATAKEHKLIAIPGLESYFRDDACPILQRLGIPRTDDRPKGMDKDVWAAEHPNGAYVGYWKYSHATLHFMDYQAYLCAVRLLSKADARAERHGLERKPIFSWSDIEELASHNITIGSSCLIGLVSRHLMQHRNYDAATAYFERIHHLFGDRMYVEVFPHVCSHNYEKKVFCTVEDSAGKQSTMQFKFEKRLRTNHNEPEGIFAEELSKAFSPGQYTHLTEVKNYRKWEPLPERYRLVNVERKEGLLQNECTEFSPDGDLQKGCNRFALDMAKKHKVPILVSDDSHFAHADEKTVQDVRLAQDHWTPFANSYHRQSSEESWAYFQEHLPVPRSEFEGWIENSLEWGSRFKNFKLDTTPSLPTKFYPIDSLGTTKELIQHYGRFEKRPEYLERLRTELEILHRNGVLDLLPYFQIDEDVCRFYENQGWITGIGRGSGGGLLLAYLLGITHVDPLKYGLSLERFITLDRIKSGKLADLDQDLPFRDPLTGQTTDVVEVEMEDGTKHILPEDLKIETNLGLLTPAEAIASGADIKKWWLDR